MNNYRGRGWLVMGVLVMFSWACMLVPQSAAEVEEDPDLAGFEETLAAEIEDEIAAETPEAVAPGPEDAPEGVEGETVEGLGGLYRLAVPAGWSGESSDDRQEWCAADPSDGCLSVEIRIKQANPEDLLAGYLAGLQENVSGYQEIAVSEVDAGGLQGKQVEAAYIWREKEEHALIAAVVYNRIGLIIAGFAAPQSVDALREGFDLALSSFEWVSYPDAPPYAQWGTYEAGSLDFTFPVGSWIDESIDEIAGEHAGAYEEVVNRLGVGGNAPRIHMILYPSEAALLHSTARQSGFAINELNEVHAIWSAPDDHQSLGHEMTHVISFHTIGDPQEALLGEGLAVCLDQSGRDYRAEGKGLVESGQAVSLDRLAGDAWFEQDPEIAYPQSGSVVCYLFERYGAGGVKDLYLHPLEPGLEEALGITLTQLEQDWIAWAQDSPAGD